MGRCVSTVCTGTIVAVHTDYLKSDSHFAVCIHMSHKVNYLLGLFVLFFFIILFFFCFMLVLFFSQTDTHVFAMCNAGAKFRHFFYFMSVIFKTKHGSLDSKKQNSHCDSSTN